MNHAEANRDEFNYGHIVYNFLIIYPILSYFITLLFRISLYDIFSKIQKKKKIQPLHVSFNRSPI